MKEQLLKFCCDYFEKSFISLDEVSDYLNELDRDVLLQFDTDLWNEFLTI